jgi:ankyrin repeat protein
MKLRHSLWMICLAAWLAGCGSRPPSDFDSASKAIYEGKPDVLASILARNKGVVTNVAPFDDATLLHYAVVNSPNIPCAKLLVEAGADVNKPDRTRATPLHLACECGARPEAVSFLVEHGADVNARDGHGETPLQIAMKPGRWHSAEGVTTLQQHGAKE